MSDEAKPEKGSQKMMISGMIMLPPGDFFTTAKRAEAASNVLNEAAAKVAEHFPGFKFTVDVSPYREHSGGRKPKNPPAGDGAATGSAEAGTASNGEASGEGPAAGNGEAGGPWPPAGSDEGYQGASAEGSEPAPAAAAASGRQSARQAAR